MTGLAWRWLKFGLLVAGLACAAWAALALGIDWTALTAERLRAAVEAWGWWSPVTYFLIYAQPLVPLPTSVMCMAAGLLFGAWWGAALALAGAIARAGGQFLLARTCGRELIQSLLRGRLAHWDARLGRHGFQTVCLIRLVPNLPYDVQNFGLGCSQVPFGAFLLGTIVGLIPGLALWVILGQTLTNPADFWRVLGLLLAVCAVLWLRRRRQARRGQAPL